MPITANPDTRIDVLRVENIHYFETVTIDWLIRNGVPAKLFDDPEWRVDLNDFLSSGKREADRVLDALCEATEPNGDVQGNSYTLTLINDQEA